MRRVRLSAPRRRRAAGTPAPGAGWQTARVPCAAAAAPAQGAWLAAARRSADRPPRRKGSRWLPWRAKGWPGAADLRPHRSRRRRPRPRASPVSSRGAAVLCAPGQRFPARCRHRAAAPASSEIPGKLGFAPRFEGADLVGVAQREADLVEAAQQAMFAERIDLEARGLRAIGGRDRLVLQVHHQLESGKGGALVEQAIDLGLAQDRKSTRLNSSHGYISYAVFCLKKKKKINSNLYQNQHKLSEVPSRLGDHNTRNCAKAKFA